MGEYVDIGGLNTWYDVQGAGDALVLLHGGIATNDTWGMQLPVFAERFRVFAPERRGHGHTPDVEGPITYDDMAADTIGFLETVVGGAAHLVGWSDGGIVGLLVAVRRPDLVRKLVPISANYDSNGLVGEFEHDVMSGDGSEPAVAMLRALYEAASPDGTEHWPVVYRKVMDNGWNLHIPREDLARIGAPTLVMSGDDDAITLEHTVDMYLAIPEAELAVVPGTSHALPLEKPELVNKIVLDFLEKDPPATLAPIRRAAGA